MKIVHVLKGRCNPDTANGVEKTIFNLAREQSKIGHKVYIYSITRKEVIDIDGIIVRSFTPCQLGLLPPVLLLKDIIDISPTIVHFHSVYIPEQSFLAILLRIYGISYTVTPNGGCANDLFKKNFFIRKIYQMVVELNFLNNAKFVHSVGDSKDIISFGVKSRVITAPNGIDLSSLPVKEDRNPILDIMPEWNGRKIFTFIGRIAIFQKGLDFLMQGFAEAVKNGVPACLMLVGPDYKLAKDELKLIAKKYSVEQFVYFHEPIYGENKFQFLYHSDFFVHTSRWEGLSFSIIEALACSTPCMVTAEANPCGLIGKYNAGLEVPFSVEGIAEGFSVLSRVNENKMKVMKNEARSLVENECQWPTIAEIVNQAYLDNKI